MIEEAFDNYFDFNNVIELWPHYISDESKILNYSGSNIRAANILLNSILTEEEKRWLEDLFFEPKEGWYRYSESKGCIAIKLAAMSLGLTNTIFTFNPKSEERITSIIQAISKYDQELTARCYLKQKVVTYYTLKNYLKRLNKNNNNTILLYRGLTNTDLIDYYYMSGMESWTLNYEKASMFATATGIVLDKEYNINQIFAGFRSTFKNRPNGLYRNNGFFVRREHEFIVENYDKIYDCKCGKHIHRIDIY